MKISNLTIGARLAAAFALVLAMLTLATLLALSRMSHIQDDLHLIGDNNMQAKLAATMRFTVADRMIALRNIALLGEDAERRPEVERIKTQAARYTEAERQLAAMSSNLRATTEEKAVLQKLREVEAAIQPLIDKAAELGLAGKAGEATHTLIREVRPLQQKWIAALTELIEQEERLNKAATRDAEDAYAAARAQMIAFGAAAVLLGMGCAWWITRSITGPLGQAVRIAQTVAAGDLTSKVEIDGRDETAKLLRALDDMNRSLGRIVSEVRKGADTIASASAQIAGGNLDLSSRTEQQAGSLEETASSMEEMTSTVKQNADNARQANQLATNATDVALRGGAVVAQVVETMGAINASAKRIVDIISVIDGIAFQTNILALNAAVEAARAGEQGRGFAVVAEEVRNLAQRSAAAAKEINVLISDSVEKVEAGTRLVDQAGATMEDIVASVKHVTGIMGEITSASEEQTAGIAQINQAISHMDEVTQQNASLVEEAASAAEALQEQAGALKDAVSVFRLDPSFAESTISVSVEAPLQLYQVRAPAAPARTRTLKAVNAGGWEEF
ncbi:methyl-accepting chemotaxis protein [Noviherbaspirillum denitrificans]|uniref:Chemotaxis protein n=1 Tax=Noviherbaspirillum denitrificans TaxID=1968433 RepID=A0A254TFX2_9BURK|nr:methyl-accepting chemotaxis protein [Noviherbaspirillum denitrificans]OWW21514.1 chemotaxis protein [Noviherbaspirillum denitrificans]